MYNNKKISKPTTATAEGVVLDVNVLFFSTQTANNSINKTTCRVRQNVVTLVLA
jgi:hypothetical protein